MPTIIDYTYFRDDIYLPQTGNTEGRTLINQFIEKREPEYLKKALGYDLWKAFTTGIEGSGTPDQRWVDLLEGKEYEYASVNNKWEGFENDAKISPIANYVYYWYVSKKAVDNTLVGTATGAVDNNTRVNPMDTLVDAWNSMVDMNRALWEFLYANKDTYPEWTYYESSWDYWFVSDTCKRSEVFNYKNTLDL